MRTLFILPFIVASIGSAFGQTSDWPEPRHDRHLTSIQPIAGAITKAPAVMGEVDLGRIAPVATAVQRADKETIWVAIVGGELRAYLADGSRAWSCHPPGINFTSIIS